MRKINSEEIKRLGETQTVEFKKSLALQKEAMEALCGMINADSATGTVIFGISPDSSISGIEPGNLDSAQKSLAQTVRQKFDPPLICSIEVLECDGKQLIALKADRATGVPYHECDGRAYIREGSSRRQLGLAEKQRLNAKRNRDQHNGPWKCDRCGSLAGTLSSFTLTDQGMVKTYSHTCGGEWWPAG